MNDAYDNSVEPAPLCMIEVQFEQGQEWQRFPTEGVCMEDVYSWRYSRPADPTTLATEPCNDCAHRDVLAWVKPCVDCLTNGKHVNFVVPIDPLVTQVDGNHYKGLKIQPVEFIHANGIGYFEGNVIKYVWRADLKGGIEDLEKAAWYIAREIARRAKGGERDGR